MDITYYKKYEPVFGSWKIVREIGEGSFGKVFEIEREDFGYTYKAALKAITIPQSKSEIDSIMADGLDEESITSYFKGFVVELVDEIRLMSKLKGESNVVSYEDHLVIPHSEGLGWDILIRMELLTPLLAYSKGREIATEEVIDLGIDICKALELCRKNDIIHRDIKPENIFVSENGKFKLGDFGIAKTVEKTTGGLSKKGTYTYMAPEVYKGEEYGPSVDIYSLGLVLYRLLNNNRTPFLPDYPKPISFNDRQNALFCRIKGDNLPAPVNADKRLADIILKACAYNPKDRYKDSTEMNKALEKYKSELNMEIVSPELESDIQASVEIREFGDSWGLTMNEYQDDSLDCTVSIFGSGNKSPKASPKPSENTERDKYKAVAFSECAAVATPEKCKDGIRYAREDKGNWYVERVYNANDVVIEETEYTSLGNRFRETQYDDFGNRISEVLFDYLNRARKITLFNSGGSVEECFEYEYQQNKIIKKPIAQ